MMNEEVEPLEEAKALIAASLRALKVHLDLVDRSNAALGGRIGLSRERASALLRGQDCKLSTLTLVAQHAGLAPWEILKMGADWLAKAEAAAAEDE